MNSNLIPRGLLTADVWDAESGRLIQTIKSENMVVTSGRNLIRDYLADSSQPARLTHFGLGTGTTAVSASDTALVTEVVDGTRGSIISWDKSSAQLTVKYYLASDKQNGNTLAEAGLFNAVSGGTMYSRVVLSSTIAKTSSIAVTFSWQLTWSV